MRSPPRPVYLNHPEYIYKGGNANYLEAMSLCHNYQAEPFIKLISVIK